MEFKRFVMLRSLVSGDTSTVQTILPTSQLAACPQTIDGDVVVENDPEVKQEIAVHATRLQTTQGPRSARFGCFSRWSSTKRAVANLLLLAKRFKERNRERSKDETISRPQPSAAEIEQASQVKVRVQREVFNAEFKALSSDEEEKTVSKESNLLQLYPFLDSSGLLRVGGRLRSSTLGYEEKHPLLLPKGHHLSILITRHFHERTHHHGRQITHGAIRQAGYLIVGGH